jgi:hypothetical protein
MLRQIGTIGDVIRQRLNMTIYCERRDPDRNHRHLRAPEARRHVGSRRRRPCAMLGS